jgi:methyl-accepting chemotaxis protein
MIRGSLGSYLELVLGVDTVVDKMLGSVSSMSTRIDDQATLAKEASDSLERFLAELESLSVYAESTMTFAGQLDGLSERGAASAGALARGMSSVKEALDDLGPVVDAVDDFAERSSLLAMNASIEAAHAGAVGRGFAVIAGEIKKLAAASSERARLIRATVHEAAERVAAQLEANRGVSDVLASVSASGSGASERIQATSRSVQALRASAEGLVRAMQELKDMTEELRRDSLAQAQGSASIRQDMSGMAGRTRDVEGLIDAIEEGNRSLIGAVKRLESVAGGGERALSELHAALSPDAS